MKEILFRFCFFLQKSNDSYDGSKNAATGKIKKIVSLFFIFFCILFYCLFRFICCFLGYICFTVFVIEQYFSLIFIGRSFFRAYFSRFFFSSFPPSLISCISTISISDSSFVSFEEEFLLNVIL